MPPTPQPQNAQPSPLDFLRNHPQFNQLKMMVQQNPSILQPVLQQLGASNPQILQLISQHQDDFIKLLNEPVNAAAMGGGGGQGLPPGAHVIQVTAEESAAIDRVCLI
jgi:UV excision repair protein RAD23